MQMMKAWVVVVCFALVSLACPASNQTGPQTGPDNPDEGGASTGSALTPNQMDEIQRTVRAGEPAVTRCYSDELTRRNDKKFQGTVVVKILIGTNGAAQQVVIGENSLKSPEVDACLQQVIRGWEFPTIGSPSWFTYPFHFSPAY